MENRLFAYFDFNPTKAYPVVYGATYTETFNEEINSINIVLDNVQEDDRLYLDRPYHFVKIVNDIPEGETGLLFNGKNSIIMLVDTFVENLNNIGGEKIYRYEIGLMNCVKLLEKIQCPNLMITHSLVAKENEPIYVYIDRYMQLYCPKVKISTDGDNWAYEYLLNWNNICGKVNPNYDSEDPESSYWLINPDPIFDVPAADMQMNEPTLRQVITNLMSQVACIPSCDFRTLTYINFREEPTNANVTDSDGINFIKHSGASDSYASDLMSSPSQTLQEKNTVVADIVSFRDSDNALIQQKKNLQLEVRYPIYKINEVRMRTTDNKQGWFKPANENAGNMVPVILGGTNDISINTYKPFITFEGGGAGSDGWTIDVNILFAQLTRNNIFHKCILEDLSIHFCKYIDNKYVEQLSHSTVLNIYNLNLGDSSEDNEISLDSNKGFLLGSSSETSDYRINNIVNFRTCNYRYHSSIFLTNTDTGGDFTQIATHAYITASIFDKELNRRINIFVPMAKIKQRTANQEYYIDIKTTITNLFSLYNYYNNNTTPFDTLYPSNEITVSKFDIPANIGTYINITPCFVENSRRRLLDVNYQQMQSIIDDTSKDLEDLAQYIYGTMGYNIGDNKISSFSDSYTRAQMWWSLEKTYFDVILEFINARRERLREFDWAEFNRTMEKQFKEYAETCGYNYTSANKDIFYVEISGDQWTTSYNKMKFLFYIYYKPLNNFKFKATKEGKNIPVAIEQLNNSGEGLSDFERTVKNLQDTVNRIGNPVKALPQTIEDISKIKPLNSIYNDGYYDFTIFQRQFAINEKYLSVNYTASENYVIKNYFTSIITKYRAYEYVDYNASTVRKENTKVFAYLSDKHYYDGDDKLRLFSEFYSFNDLKRILDVDDLHGYISTNDEEDDYSHDIIYLDSSVSVDLSFYVFIYYADYSSIYSYKAQTNLNSLYSDVSYQNISTSETAPEQQQPSMDNRYVWVLWTMVPNEVKAPFSGVINKYNIAEEYIKSLKKDYPAIVENYFSPDKTQLLLKMNGSILYDNITNKYYKINIKERTNTSGNIINYYYTIAPGMLVNEKNYIYNIFSKTNSYLNNGLNKFYPTHRIEPLRLKYHKFYINLSLITDQTELNQIIINENNKKLLLLSGLTTYDKTYTYKAKYVIKSSQNWINNLEETKNEINTLIYNKGFVLYYQDYDNVSAGPQLFSLDVSPGGASSWNPYAVGGWVQQWQIWNQDAYGLSHQVFFTYQINLKQPEGSATIDDYIRQLPVISNGWEYQPYTLFQIVDNNKGLDLRFTFYKDISEVLNQSLQIEYYGEDLIFNKYFIEHNRIIGKLEIDFSDSNYNIRCFKLLNGFKVNENVYSMDAAEMRDRNMNDIVSVGVENQIPYIEVNWGDVGTQTVEEFVVSISRFEGSYVGYSNCYDLIAFKRNGRTESTRYYLTLNDTKTNDVWYFSDPDDLFETYECVNYGDEGDVNGRQCKPKGEN